MCGIFGLAVRAGNGTTRRSWERAVESLFRLSESRGKEAAGIALVTADRIVVHKDSVAASRMLRSPDYAKAVERGINGFFDERPKDARPNGNGSLTAIGHCRLVTNGLQGIDDNNQPVWRDNAIVVHNGIVVNVDELWARQKDIKPRAEVDSEIIAALVEKYRDGGSIVEAVGRAFGDIYGETSIALVFRDVNALVLATNTGSLFVTRRPDGEGLFFASEAYICRELTTGAKALEEFAGLPVEQVRAGRGLLIDLDTLTTHPFALAPDQSPAAPNYSPRLGMQRTVEDKAQKYREMRQSMRRCTRCVLPETMPFIAFDEEGVCNYCRSHEPWTLKSEGELEELLDRYRSKDGSPDCLVAFSGGRDSSYGLHLLKTRYRMTPLAFTYDWGMVTDLARRNQARVCGKLGIEHLWVSADIKKKRDNIRRNVLAWLKKPDLGIVPLFMAGDKQFLWYANKLMKTSRIPLMVFCANRHEKTDFKSGFLNINLRGASIYKPASADWMGKLRLLTAYGSRFLANPAYLNRSLPDTAWAYLSYYLISQNYLQLFNYVDWREEVLEGVLASEYAWEKAEDTPSTWRIGDGTAAFYNYVYYMVAGFTEFDTFRSSQIRSGEMDRQTALAIIELDNQPRWKSIREYFQLINVDFDDAIRVVDRMPKLYEIA